ncbi:Hypothetical_protein [Hexamita inflata]|uniref:Hypothetical_protein n=1 Tax=Hexamita inflata TaxID=28002 RepID=A0AA86R626_9EUKA|nr:Hypothetical protein HINF_LOCUS54234 [Hexamita inflata]
MQQLKYKISIPVALKQIWDTESSPRQIDSVDFFSDCWRRAAARADRRGEAVSPENQTAREGKKLWLDEVFGAVLPRGGENVKILTEEHKASGGFFEMRLKQTQGDGKKRLVLAE